jgi:hypothetical protein
MKTITFASSLALTTELINSPRRLRLPADHQTRLAEGSLEFTAEVPAEEGPAEAGRRDFLYALLQRGGTPAIEEGYACEVSPFVPNKWLRDLHPRGQECTDELAFVKYTPMGNRP